jgi:hypothetical protein
VPSGVYPRPRRPIIHNGDGTINIVLTRGMLALADAADYALLAQYAWQTQRDRWTGRWCAYHSFTGGASISMQRLILAAADGLEVDHVNGDGLDNRRANLRLAPRHELRGNQQKYRNNISGFTGVVPVSGWKKYHLARPWRARVQLDGRTIACGNYATPVEAARAYDFVVLQVWGPFARLNFAEKVTKP